MNPTFTYESLQAIFECFLFVGSKLTDKYDLKTLPGRMDWAFEEVKKKLDPHNEKNKKDVYKALNLSQTAFSHYRRGSKPTSEVLVNLTQPIGLSVHWIATGEGPRYVNAVFVEGESSIKTAISVKHLYNETVWDICPDSLIPVNADSDLRFCEVEYPHPSNFKKGEILLIDLSYKQESGIYIVKVGATRRIVFVQFSGETYDVLDLDNTNTTYPADDVQIIGKVFWKSGPV